MVSVANGSPAAHLASEAFEAGAERRYLWRYIGTYTISSVVAVTVTLFLVLIGLDYSLSQWIFVLSGTTPVVLCFTLPDIWLIYRHYKPIASVLRTIEAGRKPDPDDVATAIVRALNLPFFSFARVNVLHGPLAALSLATLLLIGNVGFDQQFEAWQIWGFIALIALFASPAHSIFEFFQSAKISVPLVERLWHFTDRFKLEHQEKLISIRLKNKLLYLSISLTALPLFFFAISIVFKVDLLFMSLGRDVTTAELMPLLSWIGGVVFVCMAGALAMAILTASEVSRSAKRLSQAMRAVETGDLSRDLSVVGTDEYAQLFRGFNGMVASLREEVRILELSHDLAGELDLDILLGRIIKATTDLLDADRSTLFLYDSRTGELWSRVAEGLSTKEIRFPATSGIAGAVFTDRHTANIEDAYADPRFNRAVDKATGYRTKSLLAMPIVNKEGQCIGVTQVLNKRGGAFTTKDETRLAAFSAQIAVALENAKLFEDVLNQKNYNESVLKSTSDGMITLDSGNVVLTANAASLNILRKPSSEVLRHDAKTVLGADNAWALTQLERVRTSGERELAVEADFKLADQTTASLNLAINPLIDSSERSIGSLIVLEDITAERRMKSTMSRYMSPEVAEQLLAEGEASLGGKDQKVSILFSGIRNFAGISEALGARGTVSMLNTYFERMVDVVARRRGVLDKFIGDTIMALFGVPFNGAHDAADAISVANDMLMALAELNRERKAAGAAPIDIGVGVSTGVVVAGNIGSSKRMGYTVIGDSVNLGARLAGATHFYGAKILLNESTKIEVEPNALVRDIDLIRVKGKNLPVRIFEAMDHYTEETFPGIDRALGRYAEGIAAYRRRDWRQAIACFDQVLAIHPGDQPSRIYAERSRHFLARPPAEDWDGVWTMTSK